MKQKFVYTSKDWMIDKDYRYFSYLGDKCIRKTMKSYLSDLDFLQREGIIDDDTKESLRSKILDSGNNEARFFGEQADYYYQLNENSLVDHSDQVLIDELENRGFEIR